ncbi:MAG: DUF6088 family protein [Lachnospiraceae bacterium]
MNEVLDYILTNYKVGEPIFISDLEIKDITEASMKQHLKRLTDAGKLQRYEKGIYYISRESRLKSGFHLSADLVAKHKYIARRGRIMGYYSGYTFANQLGISMQVPMKVEIVSNESAPIVRDISVGNQTFTIRKSRIQITEENQKILQLLEFLKNVEEYSDGTKDEVRARIVRYIQDSGISREDIDCYIEEFPLKIYKVIYEMRLENVLARG